MKWHITRFKSALKILFELRREFQQVDGEGNILLYRVDASSDGIGLIGSFATRQGAFLVNEPGASEREFALAIETCAGGDLMEDRRGVGVRLWFGDQALQRMMGQAIDGKPNRLEFGTWEAAAKMIKDLMFAESSFVSLRGEDSEELL